MLRPLSRLLFGDLQSFREDPLGFLSQVAAEGPRVPFRRLRFGPSTAWLCTDPEAARAVLLTHADAFDKSRFQASLRPLLGLGLLTSTGEEWKWSRTHMKPAFSAAAMKSSTGALQTAVCRAMGEIATDHGVGVLPVAEWSAVASMMATRALLLDGRQLEPYDANRIHDAVSRLQAIMSEGMWRSLDLNALIGRVPAQLREAVATVRAFSRQIVEGALSDPASLPFGSPLRYLIEAGASQNKLEDEVTTLLVAGHETTASAIAWGLLLLAERPDVAERLRTEVRANVDENGEIDPAALIYARAVAQEVLRLRPSAWWIARHVVPTRFEPLPHTVMDAGDIVLVCPWLLHRLPEHWDMPEAFDPNRFVGAQSRHKFAYLPFGAGPRVCIGASLATLQIQWIMAMMATTYAFVDGTGFQSTTPIPGVTLGCPQDAKVTLRMH